MNEPNRARAWIANYTRISLIYKQLKWEETLACMYSEFITSYFSKRTRIIYEITMFIFASVRGKFKNKMPVGSSSYYVYCLIGLYEFILLA